MASSPVPIEEAGLSVSTVARRLGVKPSTLRTWDRRYGLSPSLRTAGSHRRYTDRDLAILERMRSFMLDGMPSADAARAARTAEARDAGAVLAGLEPPRTADAVDGAGTVVPLRKGAAELRGLDRAAAAMDTVGAADIIRRCIDRNGVAWSWDEVVAPVLRAIGQRYAAADSPDAGIDVEHHLSHVVIRELIRHGEVRNPVNARPVLLASAPDEQHTLPLFALSAALAERGIGSRIIGGRTPDAALASAVRRTGPVAVFIWAQSRPATDLAAAVPVIRPSAAVFVGGPGWADFRLPESVGYPKDLNEAVCRIGAAARPGPR